MFCCRGCQPRCESRPLDRKKTTDREPEPLLIQTSVSASTNKTSVEGSVAVSATKRKRYTQDELSFSRLDGGEFIKKEFPDLVPFAVEDCQARFQRLPNSFIFIGPCQGPVFLRDCQDCVVVAACQQLRLRDCSRLQVSLYCRSQPIIETSSAIEFGCFSYNYREQFERAELPIFHNEWSDIYDFNNTIAQNWKLDGIPDIVTPLGVDDEEIEHMEFRTETWQSLVPFTISKPLVTSRFELALHSHIALLSFLDQRATLDFLKAQSRLFLSSIFKSTVVKYNAATAFPAHVCGAASQQSSCIVVLFLGESQPALPARDLPPGVFWLDLDKDPGCSSCYARIGSAPGQCQMVPTSSTRESLLLLMGVLSKPDYCVSIKTTTACAPWSGRDLYINTKKLKKVYGIPQDQELDAQSWEELLLKTTGGGKAQAALWSKWAACPAYKGTALQYLRTYTCLSDIFIYSASCNKEATGLTPICPEVCENYGGAVKKMIQDEKVCPNYYDDLDPRARKLVKKRRAYAKKAYASCQSISRLPYFNQKEQCVTGVKSDQESCATSVGSTSAPPKPFVQTTAFVVIVATAGVILLGVISWVYVRRRRMMAANAGFVSLKDGSSVPLVDSSFSSSSPSGQLRCIVKYDYAPNLSDEIELKIGDIIVFDTAEGSEFAQKPRAASQLNAVMMLAELTFLLLFMAVQAKRCVEFSKSKVCNPWNNGNLRLDLDALGALYGWDKAKRGVGFSVSDWEMAVTDTTGGGTAQAEFWRAAAYCPNYDGQPIQYARSFVCLKDIFVHSASCNQHLKSQTPPLCASVCEAYSLAIKNFIYDEKVCPRLAHRSNFYKEQRSEVERAAKTCRKISARAVFKSPGSCIRGIESDAISCGTTGWLTLGFGGNSTVAKRFCSFHPEQSCCTDLQILPSFNSFTPLIQYATKDEDDSDEDPKPKKSTKKTNKAATRSKKGAKKTKKSKKSKKPTTKNTIKVAKKTATTDAAPVVAKAATATRAASGSGSSVGGLIAVAVGVLVIALGGVFLFIRFRNTKSSKVASTLPDKGKETAPLHEGEGLKLKCIVKVGGRGLTASTTTNQICPMRLNSGWEI
ncbi:Protein Xrp2 [Kappamyces sp. JEL0680]|nr:Protein Xrp2 [Kappamyces sp. JEL0680]